VPLPAGGPEVRTRSNRDQHPAGGRHPLWLPLPPPLPCTSGARGRWIGFGFMWSSHCRCTSPAANGDAVARALRARSNAA